MNTRNFLRFRYFAFAAIFLIVVIVGVFIYMKNSAYEVDVNLTPEQRAEYEAKVDAMDKKIREVQKPAKPDMDFFIEKARYLEYLGKYGKAVDVLLEAFKYYENTSVGWNNIAKLYEKMGEYKSANIFYKKLIESFNLYRYYIDMAWNFYRLGEIPKAYEMYGRYTQLTGGRDEELFNLIKPNQNVK